MSPRRGSSLCWLVRVMLLASILGSQGIMPGSAQPGAPDGIETVEVPLAAWLASRDHAAPNTLADFAAEEARVAAFRDFAAALVVPDWTKARELAARLAYQLVAIRENDNWFVVASDDSATGRDPTLVVSVSPSRDLIVQAPHMPFERGTAEQAAILMSELGPRAAIVSGAHRCASRTFTTCDGRTEVCGSPQGYRDSDPGHNTRALFHAAHVVFAERWNAAIVISLHGMREDTDGVRTSLIVSNGERGEDREAKTVATRLRLALERSAGPPGMVVSCNLPADDAYGYRKLCGYTNVQGRHVNGGADACRASVDQGTGRFIHLEQDWEVLRSYAHAWSRIDPQSFSRAFIDALAALLPRVENR